MLRVIMLSVVMLGVVLPIVVTFKILLHLTDYEKKEYLETHLEGHSPTTYYERSKIVKDPQLVVFLTFSLNVL